jgi:succinyl-diaminopimelate desuccinylase
MTLDATDPVALTQALIRCESVTPNEGGALTLLQEVLHGLGFKSDRMTFKDNDTPDIDNLYARRGGGTAGNLCFAGHTDVVPPGDIKAWTVPPFSGDLRDGHVWGRGAVDMKGAIACFIAAVARLMKANTLPDGKISLLITGDEEGPSINGTMKVLDWLKAKGETLDACIVGEPSNPSALGDEIKIGRRGSVTCELVVHGKQGHAAYPAKADNPIHKLARFVERIGSQPIDKGTENFEASNCQVTVISVPNTAANVIPADARATFNVRYNDLWRRPTIEDWVRLQCDVAAASCNATYELSFAGTGDVFLTKPGPLVDTMTAAVKSVTGRTPQRTTGGGTSDARFIKDHCPVIEFGLVNETIHKVDERVAVADLETLTQIYARAIEGYFKASTSA